MAWNLGAIKTYFRIDTSNWSRGHKRVKGDVRSLGMEIAKLGALLTGFATIAVREFGTFDKAIREALAVSTVTTEQFAEMSKMAEDMSVQLNKAATETAKGFYYLGSAGLSATEQMQSYVTVVSMARAMTVDVGQAAEGLVDIMRGFNITFEESTRVADTLVKTIITSNQVFSDLDKSMSYISSTASLTNNTLAETAAMLGVMANAGIKGSYAGVALRRSITNLMSPTSEMRDLMRELNVNVYDATGQMKPFINIVGELSDKLKGTSEEYKNVVFEILFGRRAIAGQIKIFEYGAEALREYATELHNAGGTMDDVVKKQMAALLHQLGSVWRQFQRLTRVIGENLAPQVQAFGEVLKRHIGLAEQWIKHNQALTVTLVKTVAAVGALTLGLGTLMIVLPNIVVSAKILTAALLGWVVPIGLAIAGIYVMHTIWTQNFNGMRDIMEKFFKDTKIVFEYFRENWRTIMIDWFGIFGNALIGAADLLKGWINRAIHGWTMLFLTIKGFFAAEDWEDFKTRLEEIANVPVADYIRDMMSLTKEELEKGFADLKDISLDFYEDSGLGGLWETVKIRFEADMKKFVSWLGKEKWYRQLMNIWSGSMFAGFKTPTLEFKSMFDFSEKTIEETTSIFTQRWEAATKAVMESFVDMSGLLITVHQEMLSGFESAFSNFLQLTGSFNDKIKQLMDDLFNAVYQSFVTFIAKMATQDLYKAMFGEGIKPAFPFAPAGFGQLLKDIQAPTIHGQGLQLPSLPTEYPKPQLGLQSGKVAVSITNNGEPMRVGSAQATFEGRDMVLNIVTEAVETDTTFRRNLRGE